MSRVWIIYGAYVGDELRYIGVTQNLDLRRKQHATNKFAGCDFSLRVLGSRIQRATALRLEAKMISAHMPAVNVKGNPARAPIVSHTLASRDTPYGPRQTKVRFKAGMLPLELAREAWLQNATLKDTMAKLSGWSLNQAYNAFGPRTHRHGR